MATARHHLSAIVPDEERELDTDKYGVLVHCFDRNSREQIRISINEYMGTKYLDIRVFYKDKRSEEYLPSKKGVTLATDKYPELLDGIIELGETLGYDLGSDERAEAQEDLQI